MILTGIEHTDRSQYSKTRYKKVIAGGAMDEFKAKENGILIF